MSRDYMTHEDNMEEHLRYIGTNLERIADALEKMVGTNEKDEKDN